MTVREPVTRVGRPLPAAASMNIFQGRVYSRQDYVRSVSEIPCRLMIFGRRWSGTHFMYSDLGPIRSCFLEPRYYVRFGPDNITQAIQHNNGLDYREQFVPSVLVPSQTRFTI